MLHADLTPGVLAGLAWYYLLAALMNSAAAAHVAYGNLIGEGISRVGLGPKTRLMPRWLPGAFGLFYAIAAVAILVREAVGPGALTVAYLLCAVGNALIAIQAAADAAHHAETHAAGHGNEQELRGPSLDDHIPAVGLGQPMNRTLWTLVWGIAACIFQVMGIAYAFGGEFSLPTFVRDWINYIAGPTTFFVGATIGFILMYRYRRTLANGLVAWGIVNALLLYFGLSLTDYDFREIVIKPDNVPIVGMIVLVGFFTWVGLRRAVINDGRMAQGLPNLEELEPDKTLTWPDLVYTELIAMVVGTIILVIWAVVLQAPLEQPARSTSAPNPAKAPWYFLGLQEMLVYFDPWMAGVVLPTFIIIGLMALPFIDNNKQGNGYYTIERRKFAYITFQYGFLVLWVMLILLGTFLRGPNWNFFGPYEYWDPHKLIPLNNVNLSDLFWVEMIGTARPSTGDYTFLGIDISMLVRELPGIMLVLLYFIVTPPLLGRLFFRDYIKQAGLARFLVLAVLILFMASLPIKMILRWTLNLKYLIAIPEYFFNI